VEQIVSVVKCNFFATNCHRGLSLLTSMGMIYSIMFQPRRDQDLPDGNGGAKRQEDTDLEVSITETGKASFASCRILKLMHRGWFALTCRDKASSLITEIFHRPFRSSYVGIIQN
jgi:hypothetical protein